MSAKGAESARAVRKRRRKPVRGKDPVAQYSRDAVPRAGRVDVAVVDAARLAGQPVRLGAYDRIGYECNLCGAKFVGSHVCPYQGIGLADTIRRLEARIARIEARLCRAEMM